MTIMIGCILSRDRGKILPDYLNAIFDLEYDKRDIHLAFLPNGKSTSRVNCILDIFKSQHKGKYASLDIWHLDDEYEIRPRDGTRNYARFAALRNLWLTMRTPNDTHIFSVDSDILLKPDTLNKLLTVDKPIVSTLIQNSDHYIYPQFNIHRFSRDGGIIPLMPDELEGSLVKVDFTGACVLLKREVLDANVVYGPHRQGEDVPFCQMAEEKGFDRYVLLTEELEHRRDG